MNVVPIPVIGHNRLDYIKRRIAEGYERATKGGAEWVEGSLQVAAALREGRDAVPANITFKDWLAKNGLAFYDKDERGALISLAEDLDLMREILTTTDSRSYRMIWANNKSRYRSTAKTPDPNRKPRTRDMNRATIFRTMKLGEELMARIKGTSLDSAAELDELIMLDRGAPEGEHTAIVKQLVEDAAAGKPVSAIAQTRSKHIIGKSATLELDGAWLKRMVASWTLATQDQRTKLLINLSVDLDQDHQNKLIEAIFDNQKSRVED